MNSIYESRIWKKFGNGKTLHFIVYTWIFATIFNNIADKELTKLLNANNETIYTYNYSFGATGLILVIPAALLSLLIVIVLVKTRDRFFPRLTTYKVIVFLLKLIKLLWKAVSLLGAGVVYLAFIIASLFSDGGGRSSSGGGSYHSSGGASGGVSNNSNSREELKKKSEWKARQLQKEADYAYKHAEKQAQYNIKSPHFKSRLNRADSKQIKANEAAKRARNL
ncbi:hypothetical protein [Oceanobacillus bengalensis]|uniref:Uncharacterized protein n=1 Tax=Oceanobacillus bengalensis TaxID=1435466 RepID=A0A494YT98_9BACI|nr:hypothetical protein [Oceanobacillus bengalensis]RKQ13356.1 hypothetical protein D8M05_16440 [Oceanobacillus bengalensis]